MTALDSKDDGHLRSWRLAVIIGTLCLGAFSYGLDANIIGTAIPRITTDFKSLPDVAWYGAAYLITVTAFQPFFGNLYKFFNAKIVYLVSLLVFEGMHVSMNFSFGACRLTRYHSWLYSLRCRSFIKRLDLWAGFTWLWSIWAFARCSCYHFSCCSS